jgi:hypothetical protein
LQEDASQKGLLRAPPFQDKAHREKDFCDSLLFKEVAQLQTKVSKEMRAENSVTWKIILPNLNRHGEGSRAPRDF